MHRFSLIFLLALASTGYAQTITTQQPGPWNDSNTWNGGVIPDNANSAAIVINHNVSIPTGFSVTVDGMTVNAQLTIATGGTLDILAESSPGFVQNQVNGTIIRNATSNFTGTTGANLVFAAGSTYSHGFTTTEGNIPLAAWSPESTLLIQGYTSFSNATAAGNWSQSFGHVTWNCAGQTVLVNLNGLLNAIGGNLVVSNTNTRILQFSIDQNPTINIAGDFNITGTSRIYLSTTGTSTTVNIGGNFNFTSSNASGSYSNSSGQATVNIAGNFFVDATTGLFRFSSAPTGVGTFNISRDFTLVSGTLSESGAGASNGTFNFVGTNQTHVFTRTGGTLSGILHYVVPASNTLRIAGESILAGSSGASFSLSGTVILESLGASGALTTGSSGNIRTSVRTYTAGARIVYGGAGAQVVGNGHPSTAGVIAEINNAAGVSMATSTSTVVFGGDLFLTAGSLTVANGNLSVLGTTHVNAGGITLNSTSATRTLTLNSLALNGAPFDIVSGVNNAVVNLSGTITGTQAINVTGINFNLKVMGTGPIGNDFPITGPTFIEAITLDRPSGTLTFPFEVTTQNVTVLNGDIDMNGDLIVRGDLNLATGTTLFIEGQKLEMRSQFNNTSTGGLLSADASTVIRATGSGILGTLAFTPTGNTIRVFSINRTTGGNLVTLNTPLTVVDSLTLTDGRFNNVSGLNFQNGAVLLRHSAASLAGVAPTGGPYNLILTGGDMSTTVETAGPINNLTSSAGSVTLGSAVNAVGQLLVTSGTFRGVGNVVSVASVTNDAALAMTSGTIQLTGDFTNNGTFTRGTSTVDFNGTSSILGTTNPSFHHVLVSGTLNAPPLLNLSGTFTNNGTFNDDNGTVAFLGTSSGTIQTISGTTVTEFNNITVGNNSVNNPDVRIESNQNLRGILTLANNATMDADGSANTAVFRLLSSADNPVADAAIAALSGTSAIQGSVTVERFMSIEGGSNSPSFNNGRIYRYVSSPVQNASVQDIQNEIPVTGSFSGASPCQGCGAQAQSMFAYNETVITDANNSGANTFEDGYEDFPQTVNTELMTSGRGYALFVRGNIPPVSVNGNARWDVRNPINAGPINFSAFCTYTSSGNNTSDGWNLVGNPYPSTIDWNASSGWIKSGITNTIYMQDNGVGSGIFATFNGVVGTNGGSRYIPMGQAFFVKSDGGPINFVVTESAKAPGASTSFIREVAPANVLRVALRQGGYRDEIVLHYRADATAEFDIEADAVKMKNRGPNLSSVLADGSQLVINSLPLVSCGAPVRLDVSDVPEGAYELYFSGLDSFEGSRSLILSDAFTNTTKVVSAETVYGFTVTSDPKSFGAARFSFITTSRPLADLAVSAPDRICRNTNAVITVNSVKGFRYTVKQGNNILAEGDGNGEVLALQVSTDALNSGDNDLIIEAMNVNCDLERLASTVNVVVDDVPQATLTLVGERTLSSNSSAGNTWYLNGAQIEGANGQFYVAEKSGMYKVVVSSRGCTAFAALEYIAEEQQNESDYVIYPNPGRKEDVFTVVLKDVNAARVVISNSRGGEVGEVKMEKAGSGSAERLVGVFTLGNQPAGTYLVKIKSGSKYRIVKIISL